MTKLEILTPYPALKIIASNEVYLIISDLHIGFEQRFNKEGSNITLSIDKLLQTLNELIHQHKPDKLLVLGDIKSGFSRISREEWKYVPKLMEKIVEQVEVLIIPGNHDGCLISLLPKKVKMQPYEVLINDIGLLHGHTILTNKLIEANLLIMGHMHPSYNRRESPLSGSPVWLILRILKKLIFEEFKGENEMIDIWIMPAFNTELSSTGFFILHREKISPLLRKINNNVSEALIITLDGSIIGDINSLKYIL